MEYVRRPTLYTTPHEPLEALEALETFETCTHERRPGTTVCLRCRHAARAAARERFNRLMLRGSAVAIVIATFIAAGAVGATAIRGKAEGHPQRSAKTAARPDSVTLASMDTTARDSAATHAAAPQAAPTPAPTPAPTAAPTAVPSKVLGVQSAAAMSVAPSARVPDRPRPALTPVVPAGQSDLVAGVTAVRGDTDVVVVFDTPEARTRRPEKFEQFVRTTLPLVYGSALRNVLTRIPDGTIAGQGELLTELPKRGVRIPLDGAWTIRLFPETRPGQDGPLVVRYRVLVVPTTTE